jgi:CRISPR-associated protein Cas4
MSMPEPSPPELAAYPPTQLSLELPAPPANGEAPLVPVRMINEYVYCPRLAFLEWVDGEWSDSRDTEEGRRAHGRIDAGGGRLPEPDDVEERPDFTARSVMLGSERLGIIAKMDLIEGEDGTVTPVDTKKGKRPHVAEGAYEPERVQVCAQALILEDAGYKVAEGAIWYAGSRERVRIGLDDALRARTRAAISELRLTAAAGRLPPPLIDSPKCTRCSLAGICLPDEVSFFQCGLAPRPLNPSADTALPLYVQELGARVGKSGEVLVIEKDAQKTEVAIGDVSELVLHGPISLSRPVTYASSGGWVLGHTVSTGHKNVAIRMAQYRAAFDERRCLSFARSLVAAKIRNTRVFLRRNWKSGNEAQRDGALEALSRLADRAPHAPSEAELRRRRGGALLPPVRHDVRGQRAHVPGLRLRQAHAPAARRSRQCHAFARLFTAHAHVAHHALGRGVRPLPRLLSPAAVRASRARARHDGALPADPCGFDRDPGDQQRRDQGRCLRQRGTGGQS